MLQTQREKLQCSFTFEQLQLLLPTFSSRSNFQLSTFSSCLPPTFSSFPLQTIATRCTASKPPKRDVQFSGIVFLKIRRTVSLRTHELSWLSFWLFSKRMNIFTWKLPFLLTAVCINKTVFSDKCSAKSCRLLQFSNQKKLPLSTFLRVHRSAGVTFNRGTFCGRLNGFEETREGQGRAWNRTFPSKLSRLLENPQEGAALQYASKTDSTL